MLGWIGAIMFVLGLVVLFAFLSGASGAAVPSILLIGFGAVVMTMVEINSKKERKERREALMREEREHRHKELGGK